MSIRCVGGCVGGWVGGCYTGGDPGYPHRFSSPPPPMYVREVLCGVSK